MKREYQTALILFGIAFLVRGLFAVPGFSDPGLLMRPDSATYLAPAQALLEYGHYGHGPFPTALRVPLYPLLLTPWLWLDGGTAGTFCILTNLILSSLAVPLIWFSCRELGIPEKYSLCGTAVYLLTPTPVALAPMFLSDGLFGTIAALEMFFLICFLQRKESRWLYLAAISGGFGVLVRPLNLLWILPCLFAVSFQYRKNRRNFLKDGVIATLLFACIFSPWLLRNYVRGFGWRIDTVSADSLKHNAAIVESRRTGIPAQHFRDAYEKHFQDQLSANPKQFRTADDELTYREKYLSSILKKYPGTYLKGFFHPVNFIPDVPSLLENLGLSRGNKGTLDVIINHGIFAGIKHYFSGKYWLLLLMIPLCLLLLAGYFLAIFGFFSMLWKKKWFLPLLFLPLGFYYITVTGPVAYPRFSLPILPYISLLTAVGLQLLQERKQEGKINTTSERNF